ncbi:MAG: acyl-CoA desaturase [Verrucomicrobiales bacterium]
MKTTSTISHPQIDLPRLRRRNAETSPVCGVVRWSPVKSLSFFTLVLLALLFAPRGASPGAIFACLSLTIVTLCLGHSIGLHRLLIHRSFSCPRLLERVLVYLGVLVGMGGPYGMLYLHDVRDWAQRHPDCHPFFIHRNRLWRDAWWNLHCEIELDHPPEFRPGAEAGADRFYQFLEKTWRWQQLPLALALYLAGGWAWVIWGICVRVPLCLTGHWLIGFLAHNTGSRDWHVHGHAVQGYNIPGLGLISMGEAWHNNHHAFPESARHGHTPRQLDPGWWVIRSLERIGLIHDVVLPENLPDRLELEALDGQGQPGTAHGKEYPLA